MKGECLCGAVAFEITGELPNLYQCHCSECRRVTGAAANAGTIVEAGRFRWLGGEEGITSFIGRSGYRNDFCSVCGGSVPNPMRDPAKVWIPVGSLEETGGAEVALHLYVGSAAEWEPSAADAERWDESPGLEAVERALRRTPR